MNMLSVSLTYYKKKRFEWFLSGLDLSCLPSLTLEEKLRIAIVYGFICFRYLKIKLRLVDKTLGGGGGVSRGEIT